MIVKNVVCPICGNDIRVNNAREEQKCEFCRRPLRVSFQKKMKASSKNRWSISIEPIDDYKYGSAYKS